jgi:hypothetical protein
MTSLAGRCGVHGKRELEDLLALTARRPVLRRDFVDSAPPVPGGPDPGDVWDAVRRVRKAQATCYPAIHYFRDEATGGVIARHGWSTFPDSLSYNLRQITRLTRKGSDIDLFVGEREDSGFVTQPYIEELRANLAYDGFATDYEQLRSTLLGESAPSTVAQRVALNYHRIMVDMPALHDSGQLTIEDALSLYHRLMGDVPHDVIPELAPGTPIPLFGALAIDAPLPLALASACALFNGELSSPLLDPVMLSLDINCFFWFNRVFPAFNNLMGCVFSRYYLCRAGFPVFRYLPKVLMYKYWGEGAYGDRMPCSLRESFVFDEDSIDYTMVYDCVLRLMVEYLDGMLDSMRGIKTADDLAIDAIGRIPHINFRQSEVLRRAVLEPEATFYIRSHQNRYKVAYSTARCDLMRLVELGMLAESFEGAAICYRAAPHLKAKLAQI